MKSHSARNPFTIVLTAFVISVTTPASVLAMGKAKPSPEPDRPAVAETRSEQTVRVASYNVWGLPRPLLTQPSRLTDIQRLIPGVGADVIGFQEIFSRLTYVLGDLPGYPYVAWGFRKHSAETMQGDGLLIVSRYPIIETKSIRYEKCSGTDCVARKGALMARVLIPNVGPVDFYTTHLNAGGNEGVRISQIHQLIDFINANSQDNPVVLIGDFNAQPGSEEYREVSEGGDLRDGHLEFRTYHPVKSTVQFNQYTMDPSRNQHYKAVSIFVKPRRIDYLWLKDDEESDTQVVDSNLMFDYKVNKRHLSDHFGIVMDLIIGNR